MAQTTTSKTSQSPFAGTEWTRERLDALTEVVAGESSRESISVTAPTSEEVIGTIPRLDEDAVEKAVDSARAAQESWQARPFDERAAVLKTFADKIEANQAELLDLIQLETGKARADALEEIIDPGIWTDYYADVGPSLLDDESRRALVPFLTKADVVYEPIGVVGIISPWNYPLALSFIDAIPAVMAGNGVVMKPDDKTPFTALRLAELFIDAGLPPELVQIVTGEGAEVGSALIDRIDYLTFTGSSETGRVVAEQAGRNLIDCSLELSGKNPMLVLDDATLEFAVRGAIEGCFSNAGQICIATERIYVEEPLFDDFLEAFIEQTEALTLGTSYDYGPDVGSIINSEQMDRITSHVEDARERGATVHTGGQERPDVGPHFYEPTILTDVPDQALPACEETFGPVVTVESVPSAEEAIERANESNHGLNASIFTGDTERGERLAREIDSGMVNINDAYATAYSAPGAPMGGVKESGIGRRQGPEGLKRYVEPKAIGTSRIGPVGPPPFVPKSLYAWGTLKGTNLLRRIERAIR